MNGVLQAVGATNLGAVAKGSEELVGRAKDIQKIAMDNPVLMKVLAATNISYSKENGWGVKANITGAVNAIGADKSLLNKLANSLTNVTIGQSQRGGASVNLGIKTGSGTLGINYTGATGTFGGSFDILERQIGGTKISSELNYDGKEGFSVSGNLSLGNGLGLGTNLDRNGVTASTIIHGSQSGTVDQNGVYTANQNFLSEINGGDLQDEINAAIQESNAEYDASHLSKDAANAKDAPTKQPEEGPQGIADVGAALLSGGLAALTAYGARLMAGGSGSAAPSVPAGNSGNSGNTETVVGRRREDEGNGDEPPKKNSNDGDNLKADEINARNPKKEMAAAFNRDGYFLDADTGNFYVKQPDGSVKLFAKDENGNDIVIHKDKDGNLVSREFDATTDSADLGKKPQKDVKLERAGVWSGAPTIDGMFEDAIRSMTPDFILNKDGKPSGVEQARIEQRAQENAILDKAFAQKIQSLSDKDKKSLTDIRNKIVTGEKLSPRDNIEYSQLINKIVDKGFTGVDPKTGQIYVNVSKSANTEQPTRIPMENNITLDEIFIAARLKPGEIHFQQFGASYVTGLGASASVTRYVDSDGLVSYKNDLQASAGLGSGTVLTEGTVDTNGYGNKDAHKFSFDKNISIGYGMGSVEINYTNEGIVKPTIGLNIFTPILGWAPLPKLGVTFTPSGRDWATYQDKKYEKLFVENKEPSNSDKELIKKLREKRAEALQKIEEQRKKDLEFRKKNMESGTPPIY